MNCKAGQVLSYTIHDLSLEGPSMCGGTSECVDRLVINTPGLGTSQVLCNSQNIGNQIFLDGQTNMRISFESNRNAQGKGFYILASCADQGFTQTPGNGRKRQASRRCTVPPAPQPHRVSPMGLQALEQEMELVYWQQQQAKETPRRAMTLVSEFLPFPGLLASILIA